MEGANLVVPLMGRQISSKVAARSTALAPVAGNGSFCFNLGAEPKLVTDRPDGSRGRGSHAVKMRDGGRPPQTWKAL